MKRLLEFVPRDLSVNLLTDALTRDLRHGWGPELRSCAAAALGELETEASSAVPNLVNLLLTATEYDVSQAAVTLVVADALGKIAVADDSVQVTALQDWLSHSAPDRRVHALALLGTPELHENHSEVVSLLCDALDDSVPRVRDIAFESLGRLGVSAYAALVHVVTEESREDVLGLLYDLRLWLGPQSEVYRRLANAYADSGVESRVIILRALKYADLDPELVLPLVYQALRDEDVDIRAESLTPLDGWQDMSALDVNLLVDVMLDEEVRDWNGTAWDLETEPHSIVPDIATVLGTIGPRASKALPELLRFLDDEDDLVRDSAFIAICEISRSAADVDVLLDKLKREISDRPSECHELSDSLSQLMSRLPGDEIKLILADRFEDELPEDTSWIARLCGNLRNAAAQITPALAIALENAEGSAALALADTLCRLGACDEALPHLRELLVSEESTERVSAAATIAKNRLFTDGILNCLREGFQEWDEASRIAAAGCLLSFDPADTAFLPVLLEPLTREDLYLYKIAEEMLSIIGRPMLQHLLKSLADNRYSIDAITDTMERFDPVIAANEVLPACLEMLRSDVPREKCGGIDLAHKFLVGSDSDEVCRLLWQCIVDEDDWVCGMGAKALWDYLH